MRLPAAFAIGAAAAFFLDPRLGRGRRRVLRDRSLRVLRRTGRLVTGKAKYVAGHAQGAAAEARQVVEKPEVAVDDATVKQRIMSEAFRGAPAAASEVQVDVHEGVARLFGRVPSQSLTEELVERVRKVPGVRTVEPELTVVGIATEDNERTAR